MKGLIPSIVKRLDKTSYTYEIHLFDSGAAIIDIWIGDKFYVVQIEEKTAGISMITEEDPGFDTTPQKSFQKIESFNLEFEKLLIKVTIYNFTPFRKNI